jgi:GTP-binding protein
MRAQFKAMIEDYLLERQSLVTTFVLLDARHPPQRIDLEFMAWLGECKLPFARVFTKADKLSATKLANQLSAYDAVMLEQWAALPETFVTSAEDTRGREDLLGYIESLNTAQQ